jgi:hypothetical protein
MGNDQKCGTLNYEITSNLTRSVGLELARGQIDNAIMPVLVVEDLSRFGASYVQR